MTDSMFCFVSVFFFFFGGGGGEKIMWIVGCHKVVGV